MSELALQNLEPVLQHLGVIPLYGPCPSFPLDTYAEALSSAFAINPLRIELIRTDFFENPLEAMGETPFIRPFILSPVPDEFFLVIASSTLPQLAKCLLSNEEIQKGFSDETLQEGFIQVALLNACKIFNELSPLGSLAATFADPSPIPEEGALCHDLALHIGSAVLPMRIICSPKGLAALRSFHELAPITPDLGSLDQTLPIALSYQVGTTTLPASLWSEAKVGDCILLDRCTLDPVESKGTALLCAQGFALFDVRIKGAEAKILDYVTTNQESPMTDDPSLLPDDETEDHAPGDQPLSTEKIPLTLTVELGHFQMPLEKLAQLKPGNVLDLHKGEASVLLTTGGKCVAKGELVRLGTTIGVKILKVGE